MAIFDNLATFPYTILVGTFGYLGSIVLLRISGKRTLSKWNSFDFVVTIAFGSILASTILSKSTSLLQGMLAFGVLVFYQYSLTFLAARSQLVQKLVKAKPTLLLHKGQLQHKTLVSERVAVGEVLAAIRNSGQSGLSEIGAVVLETDGTFSVIPKLGDCSAMRDVQGFDG